MPLYWRCHGGWWKPDATCTKCGRAKRPEDLWSCRFFIDKAEYRKATETSDVKRAEKAERAYRVYVESVAPKRQRGVETISGLKKLLVTEIEKLPVRERRANDIAEMFNKLERLLGADTDAALVCSRERMIAYIDARLAEGVGGQTIKRETQQLARALRLAKFDVPGDWPTARNTPKLRSKKTERSKKQKGRVHPLPVLLLWLEAVRATRHRKTKHPGEAYDMALLSFLTGLRHEELRRITPEWVEPAPEGCGTAHLFRLPEDGTKDGDERVVGLPDVAFEIVVRRNKGACTPIFSDEEHKGAYRAASKKIGYHQNIHLRDMRKNHMTLAGFLTSDARGVQDAAGHSDLNMTNRYMGSTVQRVTAVAAAVDSAVRETGTEQLAQWLESKQNRDDGKNSPGLLSRGQLVRIQPGAPFSLQNQPNPLLLEASRDAENTAETGADWHIATGTWEPPGDACFRFWGDVGEVAS